ncbi:hypothetical protein PBI_SCTP2_339 [Salicola phage SCTP-2]|nr:hypothetical protein PBI_SCTP2_339 [Salicola phage SCTP-2]
MSKYFIIENKVNNAYFSHYKFSDSGEEKTEVFVKGKTLALKLEYDKAQKLSEELNQVENIDTQVVNAL